MKEAVVRKNVQTIYRTNNLDKATFYADSEGKLHKISRFNVFGRLVQWCRGKEGKSNVRKAFDETIQGMEGLCDPATNTVGTLKKNYVKGKPNASQPDYHYSFVVKHIRKSTKYGDLASGAEKIEKWQKSGNFEDMAI